MCGYSKEEHDENLRIFLEVARKNNLTLTKEKCVFAAKSINLLGYHIADGQLKPDPERAKALLDLPEPTDTKALQRIIGMFA